MTAIPLPRRFRYHIVFSYASENAGDVHAIRDALRLEEVKVFDYAEGGNVGLPLTKTLEERYTKDAPFCAVFISKDYLKKRFTNDELTIIRRVSDRKPGYMLPVVIDGAKIPELEDIVFLDNETLSAKEVAAQIATRIREPPLAPWWFYSTELKVAVAVMMVVLIVVARMVYILNWPSRTSLKSADPSAEAIIAHVKNDGPNSSTLVGYRLKFGELPIQDAELRLGKGESTTIAPGERDVKLTTLELLTKCNADEIRPNHNKVEPLLDGKPVTLVIDVRESDDAPGRSTPRTATFPAAHLKPLVGKLVSGYDTPCY